MPWGILLLMFFVVLRSEAQVTFRNSSTNTTSTNSLTINKPTDLVAGDVMIAVISAYNRNNAAFTITAPSGWSDIATGTLGANRYRGGVYYKVATATDVSGTSYQFNFSNSTYTSGVISAFYNVDNSSPIDISGTSLSTTNSTSVSAAAITTTAANDAIIMAGMGAGYNGTSTWSNWNTTSLGALTEVAEVSRTYATADIAWASQTTAGTTGTGSATLSNSQRNGGVLIALKYAPKYFRSTTSGNWNSTSTWQQSYDNSTWTAATSTPTDNDYDITIQSGHTVAVTANVNTDQTTVNSGGQLTVNNGITLTVVDGIGTDFTVNGTVVNSGTITPTGTIAFNASSTYEHAQNGGVIPTATWNAASNCTITGLTSTAPTGLDQTFGNFIMNSNRTTWIHLSPSSMAIQGNLEIKKTDGSDGSTYDFGIEQDMTIGGNLIIDGGGYRLSYNAAKTQTVTGDLIISSGNLFFNTSSSSPYVGTLTVNGNVSMSGGILNLSSSNSTGNNGILNVKGNFTQTGGTITETGSATGCYINFNGTTTQTYSKTSGTIANTINYTVASGATLDVGTSLINGSSGTFTLNAGAGIITAHTQGLSTTAGTGSIQVTGTISYNGGANYTYNGSSAQVTGNGLTAANNLTINNPNGVSLTTATPVSTTLTLSNGTLTTTTANLLSITNAATSAIAGGSASSFINGPVRWTLPASLPSGSIYNYPVGSGTAYLPFSLVNPTTGTGAVTAQVQAYTGNTGGTADVLLDSISNAGYWQLASTGNFTNSGVSLSRTTPISPLNFIAGSTTKTGTYYSLGGSANTYGVSASNLIGTNRFFTLAKSKSGMFCSTTTLSGMTYKQTLGPSTSNTFTVSGNSLTGNIQIEALPDVNSVGRFEISTDNTTFGTILTLPVSGGVVNSTTIYVRLKAGFSVGNYTSSLSITSSGQTTKTVTCNGSVTTRPALTASTTAVSALGYAFSASLSSSANFTISGTNLADTVKVTAPTGFEVSKDNVNFAPVVYYNYAPVNATLATSNVYIRLKLGLGVGSYSGNAIVSSTGANPQSIACSGSVTAVATILSSVSNLSGFIYKSGSGPSGEMSFVVTGSHLTGNVSVSSTSSAYFAVSKTSGSGFGASVSITPAGDGTVNQVIYVRMPAGITTTGTLTVGPYNIQLTAAGAVTKNVSCVGYVVSAAAIRATPTALTGFGYQASTDAVYSGVADGGPSNEQILYVSGASLSNPVTITPPTNFEISATSGSGFQSTALTLNYSGADNRVNPTKIYVRMKNGLTAGDYKQAIQITSSPATAITDSCIGKVYASPLITAGGGGSYCVGDTINLTSTGPDIQNRYWTGPNNFYSTTQNNTITNTTAAASGDYIVTGNVTVGGNLIYNGDFSMGNYGFSSSYNDTVDVANSQQELWDEGYYAVVNNPNAVHSNFVSCYDHTTGTTNGKMLVVNGNPNAGVVVWSQSVAVVPRANYQFTYFEKSAVSNNPSQLQLYINGVAAGPVYTANASTALWTQFLYNASAGVNNVLNLELVNQNTVKDGNDFILDDIVFQQVLYAKDTATVNVNNNYPVSVAVAASQNPVSAGIPVTFTATPTNGGTTPAYVWKVNGVTVATSGTTYTYTPVHNDVVSCTLTSSLSCTSGNPASASVTMKVNAVVVHNYWKGTQDNNWGNASNWTAGYVPAAGENVEFATNANNSNQPAIRNLILDQNRTVGNLINATSLSTIIPAGLNLTVNSNILPLGETNPNKVILKAANNLPNAGLIFHNSASYPVYATVEMYSKAFINASQPQNTNRYNWQYFGIPIQSVTANPTFYGSYVRRWDEAGTDSTNHWISLNNQSVLIPFKGYEICQATPTTIVFQGMLNNQDYNSGQLARTPTALFPGQHVLANSYAAAVNIKQMIFGKDMDSIVYVYNTGSFGAWQQYRGHAVEDQTSLAGQYISAPKVHAGANGVLGQIGPMQGFVVQVVTSSANAFVRFVYNNVAQINSTLQRTKALQVNDSIVDSGEDSQEQESVSILRFFAQTGPMDKVWLYTDKRTSEGYDSGYDAYKLFGSALSPQLFSVEKDGFYQISSKPDINNSVIGFRAVKDTTYTLTIKNVNQQKFYDGIYLNDMVENKTIDISRDSSEYTFFARSSAQPVLRFKIVTLNKAGDTQESTSKISVFSDGGTVFVQNKSEMPGMIYLFDVSGKLIKSLYMKDNGEIASINGLYRGVYLVKAFNQMEQSIKKVIIF